LFTNFNPKQDDVVLNVAKSDTLSVGSDTTYQSNPHSSLQEFKEDRRIPSPSDQQLWRSFWSAQNNENSIDTPSNNSREDSQSFNQTGRYSPSAPNEVQENKENLDLSTPTSAQTDAEVASVNFDNFNCVYSSCQNITLLTQSRYDTAICTGCFQKYRDHHPAVRRKFVILQKRAEKINHPTIVELPLECNVCMESVPTFPTPCCNFAMCVTCINTMINMYNNDDSVHFGCPQCRAGVLFATYLRTHGRVQLQVAVHRVENGHYLPLQNNLNVEEAEAGVVAAQPPAIIPAPIINQQPAPQLQLPQLPPRPILIADQIFNIPQRRRNFNIAGVPYEEIVDDIHPRVVVRQAGIIDRLLAFCTFYGALFFRYGNLLYDFIHNYVVAVQPDLLVPNQPGLAIAARDQIIPWNPNGHPNDLFEVEEEAYVPENPNNPNGRFILWMGDRRVLTPPQSWRAYQFPRLSFMGWWNGATGGTSDYLTHFGGHFKTDYISILLPHSIVNELGTFWNRAARTPENYAVSLIKCGNLVAQLNINSFQERVITLYAPVVAYRLYWDEKQNVTRVRDRAYVHSNFKVSLNKTLYALSKYKFGVFLAILSTILVIIGLVKFYYFLSNVDFYYLLPFYIVILGSLAFVVLLVFYKMIKKFLIVSYNAVSSLLS
jgi:hypothetical protein